MRTLMLLIGLPVAIGLSAVSMIANWRFGVRLGAEDGDAFAYGLASVCADGLKIVIPFAIAWAWQQRQIAQWLASACLWLVITIYSFVSALSFAAVNRDEIAGRRAAQTHVYGDLRSRLETQRTARAQLPLARPADAIAADIKTAEQQIRFATTHRCEQAAGREARAFCDRYQTLQGEQAIARKADALDTEITALTGKLSGMTTGAAVTSADPQLVLFQDLSGLGEHKIKAALALLVCVLIELGSGLGLFVVTSVLRESKGHGSGSTDQPSPTLKTIPLSVVPTDDDWAQHRLERAAQGMIGAAELYADYRIWMEARGRTNAMSVTGFGRWMSDLQLSRSKVGGRIVYQGVRLREPAKLIASQELQLTSRPGRT